MQRVTRARCGAIAFIAVASSGPSAAAQVSVASANQQSVIEGQALDSLHDDVLRGALVSVRGTTASAITDKSGKFRIDSVPPGKWQIQVQHPLLDTIGVTLRTPAIEVTAGQRAELIVAVPSAATVVAARCTPEERQTGPVALLGLVQNADTETPAEGAKVKLEYTEFRIVRNTFAVVPFHGETTASPTGRFKFCGLPGDLTGSLMAFRGRDSTASIGVRVSSLVATAGLDLPEPSTGSAKRASVVTGVVRDPTGAPLTRARVSIVGDSVVMLTDDAGRFVMRNLASGTRMLSIRRLGFQPVEVPVVLRASDPLDVEVHLTERIAVLDTVRIIARRDAGLQRAGFLDRRKRGAGYFMGPEDVARLGAYDLPSLLSNAPMLRRVYAGGRIRVAGRGYGTGGGCVTYYVDGQLWFGGGVEDFIWPIDVVAVEVYSSLNAPPQFSNGMSTCESVVIWTKARIR